MIRKSVIAVLSVSLILSACSQTQGWGGGETAANHQGSGGPGRRREHRSAAGRGHEQDHG